MRIFNYFRRPLLFIFVIFAHFYPGRGCAQQTIRIGTNPNIWFAQPSIIRGEGWDIEAGLTVEQVRFPGPAQNLQAFVAGHIDVMNNNVAAALIALDQGLQIRLIAGSYRGDISLLARNEIHSVPGSTPLDKLKNFRAHMGRRPRLVTNPRGSLSDITARRWLERVWPGFSDELEIIHAGDQAQLQQIFMSNNADLCAAFASLLWVFRARDSGVEELFPPEELAAHQPGGIVVVRHDFGRKFPNEVRKLARLYDRASRLMRETPERAALHVDRYLTSGFVSRSILAESIAARSAFVSAGIREEQVTVHELAKYMHKAGYLKRVPDVSALFSNLEAFAQ